MRRGVGFMFAAALLLSGCGDQSVAISAASVGVVTGKDAASLASTTIATSPDGGIYQNNDQLQVTVVNTVDAAPVITALHKDEWKPLQSLGKFTIVGFTITNQGKAFSEPELNDLQIASDFAPDGTASGDLRHFYHPLFPLAALSDDQFTGNCGVHVDAGKMRVVLLLYPPLRASKQIVWGRYQEFSLNPAVGGNAGGLPDQLRAKACTPPGPTGP